MRVDRDCLACGQAAHCVDIVDCSNRRGFSAGDTIYDMGDPADGIWQVLSGFVALRSYTEGGDRVLVRLVALRGVFGYRSFIGGDLRSTCAQALTDCQVKHIPGQLLERILAREPRLGGALQRSLAGSLREAGERIVQLASQNARTKLLLFCASLAQLQGERPQDGGFTLVLPMALQDMAELAGIRPETMSRTLRRLEDDGVMQRKDGLVLRFRKDWESYARAG